MNIATGIGILSIFMGSAYLIYFLVERNAQLKALWFSRQSPWRVLRIEHWTDFEPSLFRETYHGFKVVLEDERLNLAELVFGNRHHPDFRLLKRYHGSRVRLGFNPKAGHDRLGDDFNLPSRYLTIHPC